MHSRLGRALPLDDSSTTRKDLCKQGNTAALAAPQRTWCISLIHSPPSLNGLADQHVDNVKRQLPVSQGVRWVGGGRSVVEKEVNKYDQNTYPLVTLPNNGEYHQYRPPDQACSQSLSESN
ncbi:unnamed protein product [Hymenolepis diminuta]|uniref:Uncharacterized protein n=1 Tax=Hymenolepis diminuta TaxID=6216 RepID=A0A564Y6V9_HYMDI|nr:unnamed protein product [Hymenolepis diminuta]